MRKNWRNRNDDSRIGGMAVSDGKIRRIGGMDTPGKPLPLWVADNFDMVKLHQAVEWIQNQTF